ncbi:osmoprotectant transport system substrate-binding protein [Frigoribacterium sp. CG_9.8]|nr:glycine betaine ABC transporter substrate-binding protein [Frigoribacterium sp. CG_9.8]MBG6107098.1 osmoprotectant transport system substrate-binding protein [Frigoribacterium sp. CG_9.8]
MKNPPIKHATPDRLIRTVAVIAGSMLALTGCGLQAATAYVPKVSPGSITPLDLPQGASLTITSKNFTEQLILGKIAVIAATAAGFEVTDLTNVPGSVPARKLMTSGDADMVWEYTGTAWLTYLGNTKGIPDKQEQYSAVKKADTANGLSWLEPAPLNNTYALAIRSEEGKKLGITKLSQISTLPVAERTFCVEPEFNSRGDGLTPMLKAYGMTRGDDSSVPASAVKLFDTGAVYTATDRGSACNFGEVYTTDGRIDKLGLTVLEDDRGFFPAYNVAPVINSQVLAEYPGLTDIFDKISPKITDTTLRQLNLRVDDGGEEPADVAYEFMLKNGFITAVN